MGTGSGPKRSVAVLAAGLGVLALVIITCVVAVFPGDDGCDTGNGADPGSGALVKPTTPGDTTVSSGFGERGGQMHRGVDLAGPVGTPIYAFADGRVVAAGPATGFGSWIVLDHEIDGHRYSSVYGHMFPDGVQVSVGAQVRSGQQIAVIGNAGQSSGAHLHFELWDGGRLPEGVGQAVDPESWIERAADPGAQPADTSSAGGSGADGLDSRQREIARQIVAVGEAKGASAHGIVIALATASQESGFRLYANDGSDPRLAPEQKDVGRSLEFAHDAVGHDHGSVNQFQQQYPWWGSLEELMNPAVAAGKFFDALAGVDGFEQMPVTVAAQTVQRSAYPDAYADDEQLAQTLYTQFKGAGANLSADDLGALTGAPGSGAGNGCGGADPTGGAPGDFAAAVIAAARRQLGVPYAWGGGNSDGPTRGISDGGGAADANGDTGKEGFDCSGLTLYAVFQASGGSILLEHFTGSAANPGQVHDPRGVPVEFTEKQPGDLIFFGPVSNTHHVAIYTGMKDGREMIIHAPESGDVVKEAPLDSLSGDTMTVRRFTPVAPADIEAAGTVQVTP